MNKRDFLQDREIVASELTGRQKYQRIETLGDKS